MRDNYETVLVGTKVVLVPYRNEHVLNYHEWMQRSELLEATASEPLTLEEEYKMQQAWRDDKDKCTFIVLQKNKCVGVPSCGAPFEDSLQSPCVLPIDFIQQNLSAMIGDVNLFLSLEEFDDLEVEQKHAKPRKQAELDIMIAEDKARRKGMGSEASRIMLLYAIKRLGIERFFVKISQNNIASKSMFEKSLKFEECNYVECFKEHELQYIVSETSTEDLAQEESKILEFQLLDED